MNEPVNQIINNWENKPQETARKLIDKYGYPQEATMSKLIWYNNGPWKRTIIHRDTIPHNFPHPHPDFLEQTIDYEVPLHLYDNLAVFDGSLTIDRTKGEVTSMCDQEAMNMLSINVLNDIVNGRRDVQVAKMFLAQTAYMYINMGVTSPYTEGFTFPKQHNTQDPGIMYFE
ncbi:hypothetical protein [Tenuibacillus multivorans]|uniref:Uncharacterized protein n=1 Tax=Tenuibacillus multivorans TaxID=237069 RepID=A0A1H0ER35_9BACI|nr:hypothetical protein [Tenuibacillus multivorans]GEL76991.1 hypothetical protein TMU01_12260 [Tenuibacillus multivorans]SDN84832.1 hypothetical protein SAMN05216498_0028 [Tenuibacillus multivorans]